MRCLFAVLSALLVGLPLGAGDATPDIVRKLHGHADGVYAVAFSPDGRYVVTGSFDHTLKLWETATGKEIKSYGGPSGHQKMVLSVAFSPDGQLIASGGADNFLKVWDVPLDVPLRSFKTADAAQAVALSPDGKLLALGGKDGAIKILSAPDLKELVQCLGHQGAVSGVAFSANGKVLASAGHDRTLRFWDTAKGQSLAVVGAHTGPVHGVLLNPNNTAHTVGADGMLKIWQVPAAPTNKLFTGHTAAVRALALSADGNQLVTGGADKSVRQFATAGKEIRALAGVGGAVSAVALHPANTFVAAGAEDGQIHLWNAADGKALAAWRAHAGAPTSVQFQPQGLLSAGADGLVKTWAIPPAPVRSVSHPEGVLAAAASADGKKLYTGSTDKLVRVWDSAKGTLERQFAGHTAPVTTLAVSANGQLLASGGADAAIRFWNQATGKEADAVFGHSASVSALALHPAGTQILSASEDGSVKLWQLALVAPKSLPHPERVTCAALSADGGKLLTGGADKLVRLWNASSGVKERDFAGPTLPIVAVAANGAGTTLAAVSADKTLTLWNAADAKVLHKIALPAAAFAVVFGPDPKMVYAGLADGSIRVFSLADGKEVKNLAAHKGAVVGLAVAPKGDVLYSAGADKFIQLWTLPEGKPKARYEHTAPVTGLALSKDGTQLAAVAGKAVKIWNVAAGKESAAWHAVAEASSVAFSPDGTRLLLAGADKAARVYEIGGKFMEAFPHEATVHAAVYIDAKRVATAGADKVVRLWTSALLWQRAHQGPVRAALFSPKGDQVFSAGDDKAVRIWATADGKEVRTLTDADGAVTHLGLSADAGHLVAAAGKTIRMWELAAKPGSPAEKAIAVALPVQALALSPNGQRLAVALDTPEHALAIIDPALGRAIQTLTGHTAAIRTLAFLPDNRTLLSASLDKTARLQDANVLSAFVAHPAGPVFAQLHSNGTQLLTGGADKTVKLWDLSKAALLKSFGPVAEPIAAVVFSKDYSLVAAAAGKLVKVWNIVDAKEILTLAHPAAVSSLAFSPDKTRLATGAADKLTRLWEVATGKELQFFPKDDSVEAVLFTPAGAVISAAGKHAHLEVPSITRAVTADAGPTQALALTPNNASLLTAGADKIVKQWNLSNMTVERTYGGATAPLQAVAVAKNNLLVAAGGADGTIRVYQLADGKELGALKLASAVQSLAFSPNSLALVASAADKSIGAWSTPFAANQPLSPEFLQPIQSFKAQEPAAELVVGPDNATLYAAGLDKALHVWRLASATPTRNFQLPNLVDAVAFQPGGQLLAGGGHDGKIHLFDLVKNAPFKLIDAHVAQPTPNPIYTVAFSPDGKQLLTSSFDNTIKLWDVAGGKLIREFKAYKVKDFEKGHQEPVQSAAISPDGKFLASGSSGLERVIKIWKVADGSVVRDLANPTLKAVSMQPPYSHPGLILGLRFTKDGKYLLSAGDAPRNEGYLAVWDWQAGKMLYGAALPLGVFHGLALSPDEKLLALPAGTRGRPNPAFNATYLLRPPVLPK
jgi:WD40 repeat protein